MYNSTTIYKPITGWKKVKNGESVDADGREIVKLAIGERISKDGKKSYVTVPVWKDILNILRAEPDNFSVYVAPGSYPQLYIKRDHSLCVYSEEIANLIASCKEQMNNVDSDLLCGALNEFRATKRAKKEKEPNISAVTALISEALGKPILHEFIASIICDFFNDAYTDGDQTAAVLSGLSYEELKDLALDSITLQMTGTYPNEDRKQFLSVAEVDLDELQPAIQDELLRRLITGRIAGA